MELIQEVKKEEYEELFSWLFGQKKELRSEIDITLAPYYDDPHIYYTEEIYNLFQTEAMQRLGKILQMSSYILINPNAYQTRLEHSKGAYRRCIEFIALKMRDPEWKEFVEKHNLKGQLKNAIKFICTHDIGHSIASHAIEATMGDENCDHEKIGEKIRREDPEVRNALDAIFPGEEEGYEFLELMCEGNIDFDRLDFIFRDFLHIGNKYLDNQKILSLVNSYKPRKIRENGKEKLIHVDPEKEIENTKEFLVTRDTFYRQDTASSKAKMYDGVASYFVNWIVNSDIDKGVELKEHLKLFTSKPIEQIDIKEYIQGNTITWYQNLIEIAEESQDENLRELATACIPSRQALKNIEICMGCTIKVGEELTKKLEGEAYEIIKNKSCMLLNTKDEKIVETVKQKINQILKTEDIDKLEGIQKTKKHYRKYKQEEPLYIENEARQIKTLDEYVQFEDETYYGLYVVPASLKREGVDLEKVAQIELLMEKFNEILDDGEQGRIKGKKEPNRMILSQVTGSNIIKGENAKVEHPQYRGRAMGSR